MSPAGWITREMLRPGRIFATTRRGPPCLEEGTGWAGPADELDRVEQTPCLFTYFCVALGRNLSPSVDDLPCLGSIEAYLLARELREVPPRIRMGHRVKLARQRVSRPPQAANEQDRA